MSTDFFERQERAHRITGRLLVAFVFAVLAMAALLYLLALAVYSGLSHFGLVVPLDTWLAPMILALVFALTVAAAGGASVMRWMDLTQGGPAVARMLGATMIDLDTRASDERRLLNIVDEMSLAAGCPAPVVYLLPSEHGINAFAAGNSFDDAVLCVTRGALDRLDRDELSAIVAHEFSHILNGDARINTALISSLHGFFSLNLMGQGVVDKIISLCNGTASDGRDQVVMWVILIAVLPFSATLSAVGFLGLCCGRLIQAGVSRQREYLADASAVQFTRNPEGLSRALQKIGGWKHQSRVRAKMAVETSHLFFADDGHSGWLWFATHPPLAARIRAIDPHWDGRWLSEEREIHEELDKNEARIARSIRQSMVEEGDIRQSMVEQIGLPTADHLVHAARQLERIPAVLRDAIRDPFQARAVVMGLLLSHDEGTRKSQLNSLRGPEAAALRRETLRLSAAAAQLDPNDRLPLVDLAFTALRRLEPKQYEEFRDMVEVLIQHDAEFSLFEWCLWQILVHRLDARFRPNSQKAPMYSAIPPVSNSCRIVLGVLAYIGDVDAEARQRAFAEGTSSLEIGATKLPSPDECTPAALEKAIKELQAAFPLVKRRVLQACAYTIAADRIATTGEVELLRAFSDMLDCPMPAILPGQYLAPVREASVAAA